MRALFLLLLACSTPQSTGPALPTPWTDLPAPALDAQVRPEESGDLHLVYQGASRDQLVEVWSAALRAGGWDVSAPRKAGPMTLLNASLGDRHLELLVSGKGAKLDVLIYEKRP
ncbi:MAG: hypothetical protein JXX28_07320 [Deltaproteobacteria bacterium]|nr:hypothetical protein [Deltaproteobacteria bacterium]